MAQLDDVVLATIADAQSQRWSQTDELLALNAQLTHELLRRFIAAWGGDKEKVPEPLEIRRPGREPVPRKTPKAASMGEMARQMLAGR